NPFFQSVEKRIHAFNIYTGHESPVALPEHPPHKLCLAAHVLVECPARHACSLGQTVHSGGHISVPVEEPVGGGNKFGRCFHGNGCKTIALHLQQGRTQRQCRLAVNREN